MSSKIREVLSVLGVTAAIAAGMSLGGGTAVAAPPKCTAVLKPHWGCLAVDNKTRDPKLHSLRIDKTCIPNLVPGKTRYATGYAIERSDSQHVFNWYAGSNCEGGTWDSRAQVIRWRGVDKYDYVTLTVVNP